MQIPVKYRSKAILFTDVAVEEKREYAAMAGIERRGTEFITVGRLDAWRGFDLVIEAFSMAAKHNGHIHLTIIGQGPDETRLKKIIEEYRLEHLITMKGKVEMDQYYRYMQECDAVINASLKEGAVTVSFDSMAMGKPLLCIDTTGYTRYFSHEYAIIVQREDRTTTIRRLSEGILSLTDKQKREKLGDLARVAGEQFTWTFRGEEICKVVTEAWNKQVQEQ